MRLSYLSMLTKLISVAGVALLAGCAASVPSATPAPSPVRVEYIQPEKFRDVGDRYLGGDPAQAAYLEELRKHIQKQAAPRLAEGQSLTVAITNVDMAGEYEPWRFRLRDVRIVQDLYPPRIDLRFSLTGADGAVIRQGERKLSDMTFLMSINSYFASDRLRYEKALLDGWLEREFPRS